jgi:hypothetical protein
MGREKYGTTSTGVSLWWNSFEPTPAGAVPACLVLHPGGEKSGPPGPDFVSQDLADNGFWGLSVEYRLAPPGTDMNSPNVVSGFTQGNHEVPGQNDAGDHGYYPEGNTDVQLAIRTARADPRCNGLVYCIGGSAGAYYTMYMAATGTVGDDCPDLAVGCSIGISNWADVNMWPLVCADNETCPHSAAANWLNITDTAPAVPTGADLAKAQAASAVTHIHAGMPSMYIILSNRDSLGIPMSNGIVPSIHSYNKDGTIGPLENGANGMIPKLVTGGYSESTAAFPELGKYKQRIVSIVGTGSDNHAHAFNYWKTSPHTPDGGSRETVIPWLKAGPAEGWGNSGGGGEPPPGNNLLGYRLWVTGGSGSTGIIGPDDVSATITDLDPNTDYVAHLVAYNQYGDSPEATYMFRSNPDPAVAQKSQPRGVYALLGAPNGFWGNVTGENFWDRANIDGCRARTGWAQIEPTEGDFHWELLNADIDAMLAFCVTKSKKLGLGIGAGINCPDWLFDTYGVPRITVNGPKQGDMAPPWNPVFLDKWRNFVNAYAAHVDAHTSLAYVTLGGIGQLMESVITQGADFNTWRARAIADGYGTVGEAWVDGATKIAQIHMDYFLRTPVIATIVPPMPDTGLPAGEPGGSQCLLQWSELMKNLYGTRFGFMNAGLNENSNANGNYVPNNIIFAQSPFGPAGFQFAHNATTSTEYGGVLDAGTAMLMKFIEIYEPNANTSDTAYTSKTTAVRVTMAAIP